MVLSIKDVCKSYGKQNILQNASFTASSGKITGIIGKNGCGKTTLLSILTGVATADSGKAYIDDVKEISLKKSGIGNMVGYVPQINPLLSSVSVADNLKLFASSKAAYEQTVEVFNLKDILKKKISKLSGGMKRRVAIACALVNSPSILIMDEPTAALDIEYKTLIHNEMLSYSQNGGMLILVTHEKEEIEMCNELYSMENGVLTRIH